MEISVVSAVNRIEIIDDSGRAYVKWGVDVELSYQDDGRTFKVFVTHNEEKSNALKTSPSKLFAQTDIEDVIKLLEKHRMK